MKYKLVDNGKKNQTIIKVVGVGGCGMDMGFHLVYTLSRELFDDGYYVKHEWL